MNPSIPSALAERELSLKARAGHVALLLVSLGMSVLTGSLWLTERSLPARTALALAVMTGMGLCWTGYALWVLQSRRRLFVFQRVVAAGIGLCFSTAATIGSLYLATVQQLPAAWPASGTFALMTLVAAFILVHARRRYRDLSARKAELERQLGD
ncbi:hypothetical protein KYC5002_08205 [Archangium violaceum]|uniref:hypothetical protein n=1 Tax=Archangium violaceum TaxID=83451 RepID=UPI002B28403B|nr:hypothetical protein KYC5002_08205 [Archangium gephyra]